jgi:HEAT repeat protein
MYQRLGGAVIVGVSVVVLGLTMLSAPVRGAEDDAAQKAKVAELVKSLSDQDSHVRAGAADALGQIGGAAKEAVPALIKALGDPDANVRGRAAEALGGIGREVLETVPALIKSLGDPEVVTRWNAAQALGEIGPGAKDAVPELERLAEKDPQEFVRRPARKALEKIRKQAARGA